MGLYQRHPFHLEDQPVQQSWLLVDNTQRAQSLNTETVSGPVGTASAVAPCRVTSALDLALRDAYRPAPVLDRQDFRRSVVEPDVGLPESDRDR